MSAVRYTFGFRGDAVWLVGRRAVGTVAPLSSELVDLDDRSGFWCEVRGAGGRPVHRQPLRDPRHPTDEVPGQPRHVPHPEPSGVFTVLVPELPATTAVVLVQRRPTDAVPVDVLTVPVP